MKRRVAGKRRKLSPLGRRIIEGLQEAVAHARGETTLPVRRVTVPDRVDVQGIRVKCGLSQVEFASRYGFSTRTLQEWEQGRAQPESAARAYLLVIARNPRAVEEALSAK
jgi:putative transcriptional regulator